jgi:hypothetical protein
LLSENSKNCINSEKQEKVPEEKSRCPEPFFFADFTKKGNCFLISFIKLKKCIENMEQTWSFFLAF